MTKTPINRIAHFKPGQRRNAATVRGGGGPANVGARTEGQANRSRRFSQPMNFDEDLARNEYRGPAAPSTTPLTAGIPANNFRGLGDLHGGRQ